MTSHTSRAMRARAGSELRSALFPFFPCLNNQEGTSVLVVLAAVVVVLIVQT